MAIELCSENSVLGVSPRISFSHDLCQTEVVPVEQHNSSLNSSSTIDFDFHVRESFDQDSSSADELFFQGKILPVQIKKKISTSKKLDQSSQFKQGALDSSNEENSKKEIMKETEEKQSSKSFWRFKRSTSLNCGSGYGPSLCPLPLLSRSNSTGSACNVKRSSGSLPKDSQNHNQKQQHSQKHSSFAYVKSTQSSPFVSYQKPPLKKSYGSYGNSAVHISPVLHVPSASLFGFGSVFANGKDKNKKK